ncbi:polysaccharide pyruvyl transferase family protein [Agromyces sp. MMS24-K17]|uniref:polysaccharide pyruvyl transferase family protein n=1 Tax=Agromyces sp. MMS24-K17 TaxID=3372850 RepID=UPI003755278A
MSDHIFAPGGFDHRNRGDAALVRSMVVWMGTILPGRTITVTSFFPSRDSGAFGVPAIDMVTRPTSLYTRAIAGVLRRIPLIGLPLRSVFHVLHVSVCLAALRVWVVLFHLIGRGTVGLLPRHVRRVVDEILRAEYVITVPGGYLIAQRRTDTGWLYHVPTLALARWLHRAYDLGPCSFGPFVGISRPYARWVWRNAGRVFLREQLSANLARDMGLDLTRVIQTTDLGFFLDPSDDAEQPACLSSLARAKSHGRHLFGVSVRDHNFPSDRDPRQAQENYLAGMADAIGDLVDAFPNALPVVFAQTADDVSVSRDLAHRLESSGVDHLLVLEDLDPLSLMLMLREFELVVGTRMHACILALRVGVPVIGIAYEPKTPGVLDTVGLADWSIPIESVHLGALVERLLSRWASRLSDVERARVGVDRARAQLLELADEFGAAMKRARS